MAQVVMNNRVYQPTTVYVSAETHAAAKQRGLNFSRVIEKALVQELAALGVSVRPTPTPAATPEPARRPSASTHKERR
jgi:hypothetical protein